MRRTGSNRRTGQIVLVTGAARGIGEATARLLIAHDFRVVIADLDEVGTEKLASELGAQAWGVGLDVTDRAAFSNLLDRIEQRWGPVDVLVNNAGIMPLSRTIDESPELARAIVDVNLVAVVEATKEFVARAEGRRRPGHVVNVSSAAARAPLPGATTYTATKHAVTGFSNALHLELKALRSPARVSAVHPGMVKTAIASGFTSGTTGAVSPDRIAKGILSTIRRPRPNVYVPGFLALALGLQGLTPFWIREWTTHRFGGEAALGTAGSAGRQSYDAEISGFVRAHNEH